MSRTGWWMAFAIHLGCALLLPPAAWADDQSRAEAEFAALLRDRPRIAATLETRPKVRDWILKRLAEQAPPIRWDPMAPVSGRAAEWDARDPKVTLLRVAGSPSGIDQLTHLVFELHNVRGYESFAAIHEQAVRGEINRDEYATRMLGQEFRALVAARQFYREHLSNLSRAEAREARSYYRLLRGAQSLEEHAKQALARGVDLRNHYRTLYDDIVLKERAQRQTLREQKQ